jgi:hydrogenase nickel incorporation protein HypA/HybF
MKPGSSFRKENQDGQVFCQSNLCGVMVNMHELSITQSILDIALRHAKGAGAKRIVAINLVIGELTGFVDDSIQFYFDFLSKDTLAQDARLNFDRIAPLARCHACGAEYNPPNSRIWTCPECNALGGEVVAGREFSVASIEIE